MGCKAGQCAGQCKTSTLQGIFIMAPSLEGWPTKAKEAPSPPGPATQQPSILPTNPVFF